MLAFIRKKQCLMMFPIIIDPSRVNFSEIIEYFRNL